MRVNWLNAKRKFNVHVVRCWHRLSGASIENRFFFPIIIIVAMHEVYGVRISCALAVAVPG